MGGEKYTVQTASINNKFSLNVFNKFLEIETLSESTCNKIDFAIG